MASINLTITLLFEFQHIEYLLLLLAILPICFLFVSVLVWKKRQVKKIGDPSLIEQLIGNYSQRNFLIKFILSSAALVLLMIALANPRSSEGSTTIKKSGEDIMIALDVSKSMLADDIKPSRLERAKQLVSSILDQNPDDRIGIVLFAGRAYLQMPLTTDHAAARMYLSAVSTDAVPTQGTVIADALKMCSTAFNAKEKKYKSIILISDGEDHDDEAVKVTKSLYEEGVMVSAIGLGSPEGTMIKDPASNEYKRDADGNVVVTKLEEKTLQQIANQGHGIYRRFTNIEEVSKAISGQLNANEHKEIVEKSARNYYTYFYWFLLSGFILLMIEFFITERNDSFFMPLFNKKKRKLSFLLLLLSTVSMESMAQNQDKIIYDGNQAFHQRLFPLAAEQYNKAIDLNAGDDRALFNLGNTLYQQNKMQEALAAYDNAIEHSRSNIDKAAAWYNKGVVLQKDKKIPECIQAYKNALKFNPSDEDARLNLQKAMTEQKNQSRQQPPPNNPPKDSPKNKQQPPKTENNKNDKNNQPAPSKPSMTKEEAAEQLKSLMQQEKKLQGKMRKLNNAGAEKPEKDW